MNIIRRQLLLQLRLNRLRLRNLLRHQPRTLQHVVEVRVPAEVQLIRAVQPNPPVLEQPRQHPVDDRRANLRLDVVPNNRHALVLKPLLPIRLIGNKHRDAVHKCTTRRQHLLHIPLRRLLRTHRKVVDHYIHFPVPQNSHDVSRRTRSSLYHILQILPDPVVCHPTIHRDTRARHIVELQRIVRLRKDRFVYVYADLLLVNVERRHNIHIANRVTAQNVVHHTRHRRRVLIDLAIFVNTLNQR